MSEGHEHVVKSEPTSLHLFQESPQQKRLTTRVKTYLLEKYNGTDPDPEAQATFRVVLTWYLAVGGSAGLVADTMLMTGWPELRQPNMINVGKHVGALGCAAYGIKLVRRDLRNNVLGRQYAALKSSITPGEEVDSKNYALQTSPQAITSVVNPLWVASPDVVVIPLQRAVTDEDPTKSAA